MTKARIRQLVLALGLALSLAASGWIYQQESLESEVASPVQREDRPPAVTTSSEAQGRGQIGEESKSQNLSLDLKRLNARQLAGTDIDPFRTKSWFVPPPPPPPEPPPKPTAPPLPFQFVGKTEEVDGGKPAVYLANGNEFYTVSAGDKFAENYQLERIDPGALVIRYLPLSIIQTLPIGIRE